MINTLTRATGNATVDALIETNITGNVVPLEWYHTETKPGGGADLTAIAILADIVYWYRPQPMRDEITGAFIGYRKRFRGKYLQRSYKDLSERLGISKDQTVRAVKRLEELGIIERVISTLDYDDGMTAYNVLFIDLKYADLMRTFETSAHTISEDEAAAPEQVSEGRSGNVENSKTTYFSTNEPENIVSERKIACKTLPGNNGVEKQFCREGTAKLQRGACKFAETNTRDYTETTQKALAQLSPETEDVLERRESESRARAEQKEEQRPKRAKADLTGVSPVLKRICETAEGMTDEEHLPQLIDAFDVACKRYGEEDVLAAWKAYRESPELWGPAGEKSRIRFPLLWFTSANGLEASMRQMAILRKEEKHDRALAELSDLSPAELAAKCAVFQDTSGGWLYSLPGGLGIDFVGGTPKNATEAEVRAVLAPQIAARREAFFAEQTDRENARRLIEAIASKGGEV